MGHALFLLPALLRTRALPAAILFVLPCSFASAEAFRCLPPRRELMGGILGADAIAVFDADHARQLANAAVHAGASTDTNPLRVRVASPSAPTRSVTIAVLGLGLTEGAEGHQQQQQQQPAHEAALVAALHARHSRTLSCLAAGGGTAAAASSSADGDRAPPSPGAAGAAPLRPELIVALDDEEQHRGLPLKLAAAAAFFTRFPEWQRRAQFVFLVRAAPAGCSSEAGTVTSRR